MAYTSAPGSEKNSPTLLAEVTSIVATTEILVADSAALGQTGARGRITLLLLVTEAADTPDWACGASWTVGGASVQIAGLSGISTTGIKILTPNTSLDDPTTALPLPNRVVFTQTTGTLSAKLYQFTG